MRRNVLKSASFLLSLTLVLVLPACTQASVARSSDSRLPSESGENQSRTNTAPDVVRVGIHSNAPGASLFATALKKGYFDEENIKPDYTIVSGGAAEMAAMRSESPSLDIGFIGAGVSWNAMDAVGVQISFVFLDDISNNEQLLVAKSVGIDERSSWQEIYHALKAQTIFVDTSTTPGGWLKQFINRVNLKGAAGDTEVPDNEKLWITTEDQSFLSSYENPNPSRNDAYKVSFFSMGNDAIPAAFQSGDAQICCCYSPSSTTIRNAGGVKVATAATHMPDYTYINTWVANNEWLKTNSDIAQRFINALVKAMDYRASNEEEAARLAEQVTEVAEASYHCEDYVTFSAPKLSEYLKDFEKGQGYAHELMELLYNEKVGNIESKQAKSLQDSCQFSYMGNALTSYLK